MLYIDIHAHWSAYTRSHLLIGPTVLNAHTPIEMQSLLNSMNNPYIIRSLGIHPQDPNQEYLEVLMAIFANEEERKKIHVLGEVGFDLHPHFRDTIMLQEEFFVIQIQLAIKHGLPVIIHQRRAMEYIFKYVSYLKQLRAVIFHGYSGSWNEIIALRKKGVLAFFSIGTPILWGSKIAERMAKEIPLHWLFLETDAPYQPIREKVETTWTDLMLVYKKVADLRQVSVIDLQSRIYQNFIDSFGFTL
ncbi:TatD family hydrolase [Entomospira nematocerorum]|uniref:Uncharacterized protein n=1 Tax=Entomospira nematocerorum TaxID=2719987 RepID=A0A968GBM0_9SPIO|nr:TatD family hydrolase [Entomospira nematocera]NIZ46433.1 hypothetical protein [Entomospira nematocera]WDI33764.1 TatD family hydrolase [Entomospira nematocera]